MFTKLNRPPISNPLNKKILILAERMYEDFELWYPRLRLEEAGAEVVVVAPENITYEGYLGLKITPDLTIKEIDPNLYDGIIIPGGYAPDFLRRSPEVLDLVRNMNSNHKLVAFICHGGWVPISAKIVKGKHVAGHFALKDDMVNAGGLWVDEPVVIDGNLISSRKPDDLPCFCHSIINYLR